MNGVSLRELGIEFVDFVLGRREEEKVVDLNCDDVENAFFLLSNKD